MDILLDENELRNLTKIWFEGRFQQFKKHLEFVNLHELGITATEYLTSRFSGEDLTSIPYYNRLGIKPDVIGIIIDPNTSNKLWVMSECKVGTITQANVGQALRYANAMKAYFGSLNYCGRIGNAAERDIRSSLHFYVGTNSRQQEIKRDLEFYQYDLKTNKFNRTA